MFVQSTVLKQVSLSQPLLSRIQALRRGVRNCGYLTGELVSAPGSSLWILRLGIKKPLNVVAEHANAIEPDSANVRVVRRTTNEAEHHGLSDRKLRARWSLEVDNDFL